VSISLETTFFENLAIFCGIGFIRSDSVKQHLTVDIGHEGGHPDAFQGIFSWDKATIEALNIWSKSSAFTFQDKQLHMVAYLLELGYDLMLDDKWNVSTMPGFEMF